MDAQVARRSLQAEHDRLAQVRAGLEDEHPHEAAAGSGVELSALDQHQADAGSEVFEREKDLSILALLDAELRAVEDALVRLDEGAYGTCQTCGRTIPVERLTAVPATRFCADHEALWEVSPLTQPLPAGPYPDGPNDADELAAKEALLHLDLVPTEEDEELRIGPEERALHLTGPNRPRQMTADQVEQAEMMEADLRRAQRARAEQDEAAARAEADAAELEDEALGGPT